MRQPAVHLPDKVCQNTNRRSWENAEELQTKQKRESVGSLTTASGSHGEVTECFCHFLLGIQHILLSFNMNSSVSQTRMSKFLFLTRTHTQTCF